jgi:integrase
MVANRIAIMRSIYVNAPLRVRELSAHSLRSGFVTEAARFGISLGQTTAMTGHKSVQTVMSYYQSGALSASTAARLFDESRRRRR